MSLIDYIFENSGDGSFYGIISKKDGRLANPSDNKSLWRIIKNEMEWDKVKDDDVVIRTADEQRAISYKRAGKDEYVLWYNEDGQCTNRSIGLIIAGDGKQPTVKSVAKKSATCVVINDYERFSSAEVRRARREMQENINKLKEDKAVAQEYLEKWNTYADTVAKSFETNSDIIVKADNIMDSYVEMFNVIRANAFWMKNYTELEDLIGDIEKSAKRIIAIIEDAKNIRNVEFSKKFMADYEQMKYAIETVMNKLQ